MPGQVSPGSIGSGAHIFSGSLQLIDGVAGANLVQLSGYFGIYGNLAQGNYTQSIFGSSATSGIVFSGASVFAGLYAAQTGVTVNGPATQIVQTNANAPLNTQIWDSYVDNGGTLHARALSAAGAAASDWITATRNGGTVSSLTFTTGAVALQLSTAGLSLTNTALTSIGTLVSANTNPSYFMQNTAAAPNMGVWGHNAQAAGTFIFGPVLDDFQTYGNAVVITRQSGANPPRVQSYNFQGSTNDALQVNGNTVANAGNTTEFKFRNFPGKVGVNITLLSGSGPPSLTGSNDGDVFLYVQ